MQKDFKEQRRAESKAEWIEKVLCTQFLRQTEIERNEKTWAWIRRRELKRKAEYLIVAAQDQAIRANDVVKSLFLRYTLHNNDVKSPNLRF